MIRHFCDFCKTELKAEPGPPSFTLPDKTQLIIRFIVHGKPGGYHPAVCEACVKSALEKIINPPPAPAPAASAPTTGGGAA